MTDVLTINTEAAVAAATRTEPLPLYDGRLTLLSTPIPEYSGSLPNSSMTKLVQRMKLTMKQFGGIGLSANQCGVSERVFIIGTDQFQFVCINPKIVEHSPNTVKDKEGCLSYPGLFLSLPRYEWIVAEFTDENGNVRRERFDGITARCFQHELDHMNGIRYTDHVGPVALQLAKQKREKLLKQTQRKLKNKNALLF